MKDTKQKAPYGIKAPNNKFLQMDGSWGKKATAAPFPTKKAIEAALRTVRTESPRATFVPLNAAAKASKEVAPA